MNVLVVDVGGTHVKILATGQKQSREFPSGPKLTPKQMVPGVKNLAKAFGTQAAATGFAVASVLLGCAVGAFGAGTLADSLGRRPTMLLNAILFLASAVATGAANSPGVFIAARIAGGIAIGAASVLAPMYIAEVAPAEMRGRLASLQQLAIVSGLFGAFLRNDILARLAGGV